MTQQDVSQVLGFKNHTGYAHWEGDRTSPSVSDLERIAVVFGVSVFEVLGISGMRGNDPNYDELKSKVEHLERENAEFKSKNQMLEGIVLRAMGKSNLKKLGHIVTRKVGVCKLRLTA